MKNNFLTILAIVLFLVGCQESKSKVEKTDTDIAKETPGNKPVIDTASNEKDSVEFSISPPVGWTKTTQTMMGHEFTLLRSAGEGASDKFLENVNVVVDTIGNTSLDEYAATSLSQMETLEKFKKRNTSRKTINGNEFGILDYSHTYSNMDVEVRAYYTIKDGKVYVITCSAERGSFNKCEPVFDEVIHTFHID